ncbi:MAG: hypothetical protein KBT11_03365 [Treponema sp.]|nr:hypothetical protein [Candidatus Treponema equifaecale]
MAVAALVLGIIALLGGSITGGSGGVICGILAIIFGFAGRKDKAHKGMATAGIVLGFIALFGGLILLFLVGAAAVGLAAAATI